MSSHRRMVVVVFPPCYWSEEDALAPDMQMEPCMPQLGCLMLCSGASKIEGIRVVYLDGMAIGFDAITDFITRHKDEILLVGISIIVSTYIGGMEIARHTKRQSKDIRVVIGNDYASIRTDMILRKQKGVVDDVIFGNDSVGPFQRKIAETMGGTMALPEENEGIYTDIDYSHIDRYLPHREVYDSTLADGTKEMMQKQTGVWVNSRIPVEIARGCIKFKDDYACSFCSILPGTRWKDEVSAVEAWAVMERAYENGYNYMYLTADEVPITFAKLTREMAEIKPEWAKNITMTGYGRCDGLANIEVAQRMFDLGFRSFMMGLEAGVAKSLQALRKPLSTNLEKGSEDNLQRNIQTLENCAKIGLDIRMGYVLGHLGETPDLLHRNCEMFKEIITTHGMAIESLYVETLQPEPGAVDFQYLIDPNLAEAHANALGLEIASREVREKIAEKWREMDEIVTDEAVHDYHTAFMPNISFDELQVARRDLYRAAHQAGIGVETGYA